jgi:hypothetical protein
MGMLLLLPDQWEFREFLYQDFTDRDWIWLWLEAENDILRIDGQWVRATTGQILVMPSIFCGDTPTDLEIQEWIPESPPILRQLFLFQFPDVPMVDVLLLQPTALAA